VLVRPADGDILERAPPMLQERGVLRFVRSRAWGHQGR
jgi:hypothetical protein